jgi:putative transposase
MTGTVRGMSPAAEEPPQSSQQPSAEALETARDLVRQSRDRGVSLTGPDGLLKALTKTVIETALDEEMNEHLGYDKHDPEGRNRATRGTGSGRRRC